MRCNVRRVSAPLLLEASTGLNDDLNGVERPVDFDIGPPAPRPRWCSRWQNGKRGAAPLWFRVGKGLYCDMNAIRRDEELDNLHSVYVDQWDWEK